MYLGHSFLAFALVAAAGHLLGADRRRVLVLAGLAAGYGLLPDVDVWRTGYVFLQAGPEGVFPTEEHLWRHSWVVHRALTHSVVTGGVAAAASGLAVRTTARYSRPARVLAALGVAAASVAMLAVGAGSAGRAGVVTVALFLGGALALAAAGHRYGATAGEVASVAAVGLLTHPFGDFWMGRPPPFLAPIVAEPPLGEMALSSDPVLHFVAAVAVEVALLGACLHLVFLLYDRRTLAYVSPLALSGFGYAAVLGRVPDPTFAEAYQFTTGLFLLAATVAVLVGRADPRHQRVRARAFVSGVAAFGAGLVGYTAAYALL